MELSGHWRPAPRLRADLDWQDANVFGSIYDPPGIAELVAGFMAHGWSARLNESDLPEVTLEWAGLQLQHGRTPEVILRGVMDVGRLHDLGGLLTGLGLRYSLETWDEDLENVLERLQG